MSRTNEAMLLRTSIPWCLVSSALQRASLLHFPNKIAADFLQFPTLSLATSTNFPTNCLTSTKVFSFMTPSFSISIPNKLQVLQKSNSCWLFYFTSLIINLNKLLGMSGEHSGIKKRRVVILMICGMVLSLGFANGSVWAILSKVGSQRDKSDDSVCLILPIVRRDL